MKSLTWKNNSPDYVVIASAFILVIIGLAVLASASSDLGQLKFNDSYFYLKHQILYGLSFGLVGFWAASRFYYRNYERLAVIFLVISLILLSLIFTPLGSTVGGATRWLKIGPIIFQPSELLKITLILYLAYWLSNKTHRQKSFWGGFVPFLIITGLVSGLIIFQPSTSAVIILMSAALIAYFASGARLTYIFYTIILGLIGITVISYLTPYRWERIKSFIDPQAGIQSTSYQLNQALIAIGSGGLFGAGFGKSTTKLRYLPQPIGDSIFAIIAEEFGFIGASFLILIFLILIIRVFILSARAPDKFGQLILIGFGSIIAVQTFIHIGAISGLIPLTGVPLPYISYGGTALATFMTISGIIVNVSKYT